MSQISRSLLNIARCDVAYRGDRLAPEGLKSCHASYLTAICENPGISQDRLAQMLFFNKSNVARQAAVLEEEGYLTRIASESDRRVMMLYPTQKALEQLPRIQQMLRRWEEYVTQGLSSQEIAQLTQALEKMEQRAACWQEQL